MFESGMEDMRQLRAYDEDDEHVVRPARTRRSTDDSQADARYERGQPRRRRPGRGE